MNRQRFPILEIFWNEVPKQWEGREEKSEKNCPILPVWFILYFCIFFTNSFCIECVYNGTMADHHHVHIGTILCTIRCMHRT